MSKIIIFFLCRKKKFGKNDLVFLFSDEWFSDNCPFGYFFSEKLPGIPEDSRDTLRHVKIDRDRD